MPELIYSVFAWLWRAVEILLALGGIILVHELGHFLLAKWTGVGVDEFAVGVGPAIAKWERGGTRYRLAPLLVMGYVKIRGMEGEELISGPVEGTEDGKAPDELDGGFYSVPYWQRVVVLAGGAIFNLIAAVLIFSLVYGTVGVLDERTDTTLGEVVSASAAEQAGLVAGDRIVAIDGQPVSRAEEVQAAVKASAGAPLELTVHRAAAGDETRTLQPIWEPAANAWRIGVTFRSDGGNDLTIGRINRGGPAHRAGLRRGDRLLRVGDRAVTHPAQVIDALTTVPPELEHGRVRDTVLPPVPVTVERGQEVVQVNLQPKPRRDTRLAPVPAGEEAPPISERDLESYLVGDPGFQLERRMLRLSPLEALREGLAQTADVSAQVLVGTMNLFRGRGLKQVGGPVMIVRSLSDAASLGLYDLLLWAAMLSIMIGLFNLLPIPALDGGRIVFVLLEWVMVGLLRMRAISRHTEGMIHAVGLLLLLLLIVVISIRDVLR